MNPILTPQEDHSSPQFAALVGSDAQRFTKATNDLQTLTAAQAALGLSRATFWRFRKRHRIKVVTGWHVSLADLTEAIECERRGMRRIVAERTGAK